MQTRSMDFFANQDAARRKTGLLVFYYAVAVVLIIIGIYVAAIATLVGANEYIYDSSGTVVAQQQANYWNSDILLWVTGIVLLIVLGGSTYKVSQLSSGGESVARLMGGRPVLPETNDADERKLLNIVEEMSIASGVAMPQVFVMDNEDGINAFAAGYNTDSAVVAVTRGCIETLNRDELQGVIAHEFSHILNGDMRLNIRLMGVLHGILVIGVLGYFLMRIGFGSGHRHRSRSDKKGNTLPIALFGLAVMAIGYIGVFFGNLIKSAVSRQREFLADASAVQFTRNPDGIAGALKKIGGASVGARVTNAHAGEASHFFFANAMQNRLMGLMATHPPLAERIRRIDPAFDGTFVAPKAPKAQKGPSRTPPPPQQAGVSGFAAQPETIVASAGTVSPAHIDYARSLIDDMPSALKQNCRDAFGARAVIYALLLDKDPEVQARQMRILSETADANVYDKTLAIIPSLAAVAPRQRLPLIDVALPALRQLSSSQYAVFDTCINALIAADEEVDLFEYALGHLLRRKLAPHFDPSYKPPKARFKSVAAVLDPALQLLSSLAAWGADAEADADAAFANGVRELLIQTDRGRLPANACGLSTVDASLDQLAQATGDVRRRILTASCACIVSDNKVTDDEAELIRAVASALDCPLPPIIGNDRLA